MAKIMESLFIVFAHYFFKAPAAETPINTSIPLMACSRLPDSLFLLVTLESSIFY